MEIDEYEAVEESIVDYEKHSAPASATMRTACSKTKDGGGYFVIDYSLGWSIILSGFRRAFPHKFFNFFGLLGYGQGFPANNTFCSLS